MVVIFLLKGLFIDYLNGINFSGFLKRLFVAFTQQSFNTFISLLLTFLCETTWIKSKCFLNKKIWVMMELANKYSILKVVEQEYILAFWKNEMDFFINSILPPMKFINTKLFRQMSLYRRL